MPTGYTAKLMEHGQTFKEFAMDCARAFGACVTLRDSHDEPIPEKFEPSSYHLDAIQKSKAQLASFWSMNESERQQYGVSQKVEALRQNQEWLDQEIAENNRIAAMEVEVQNWVPPSREHEEMKKFMLEQLGISKNRIEYQQERTAQLNRKHPETFYLEAVMRAEHDVAYHTAEHAKEVERTNSRTEWIQQLRKSLETTKTP